MQITNIKVKYFRSLENFEFQPKNATLICGTNSAGKSNVLRAIRLAFMLEIRNEKLAENLTNNAGPNAICGITITFDGLTSEIASNLGLPKAKPVVFKSTFRRSGPISRFINDVKITDAEFAKFCEGVLLIYVPAIRDITVDGLKPFKHALVQGLKKQKGAKSIAQIDASVRGAIKTRGQAMLAGPNSIAKQWLNVTSLNVDTTEISIEHILPAAGVSFSANGQSFPLSKLGTGHQSAVIIKLYRELGAIEGKFVLYLFEEPDNHLHPTSIGVVADELLGCVDDANSQLFVTTHSPYLLNHFDFSSVLSLTTDERRLTIRRQPPMVRDAKALRVALGKFGLKPAEALLARRVIVVEGPNDTTVARTLIELHKNSTPERLDYLVLPAGGKGSVVELCVLLEEIGAEWRALLDWDSVHDTNRSILDIKLSAAEKAAAATALNYLIPRLNSPTINPTKISKQLAAMLTELHSPPITENFDNSVVGKFVQSIGKLTVAQKTALRLAVKREQPVNVNKILAKSNIFVWKAAIEEAVIPDAAAVTAAETFLKGRGKMNAAPAGSQAAVIKNRVIKAVKGLAHEPEHLDALIQHLWINDHYKHKEAVRAIRFLTAVSD